jgi:hypothetical protein
MFMELLEHHAITPTNRQVSMQAACAMMSTIHPAPPSEKAAKWKEKLLLYILGADIGWCYSTWHSVNIATSLSYCGHSFE